MDELIFFINKVRRLGRSSSGCDLCAGRGRRHADLRHPALRPFRAWRHDDAGRLPRASSRRACFGDGRCVLPMPLGFVVMPSRHGGDGGVRARPRAAFYAPLRRQGRQAGDAADRLDRRDADDPGPDPPVLRVGHARSSSRTRAQGDLPHSATSVDGRHAADRRDRTAGADVRATGGGDVRALHFFLTRSRLGKAMRAMADNADLAQVSGINTKLVDHASPG